MLRNFLNETIKDIEELIEITIKDIEDIKLAKHDSVFDRVKTKNILVASFEEKKSKLDSMLVDISNSNKNKNLSVLLSDEEKDGFQKMKQNLETLHTKNKEYARFVVAVGEFYNALIETMFPSEQAGYEKNSPKPASILKIKA